jgi:hypothetical protein
MDITAADLAATVRAEAARRKVSQVAIGDLTNHTQRAVSRRWTGEVDWSVTDLEKIAALFGMTVDGLLALARRDAKAAAS